MKIKNSFNNYQQILQKYNTLYYNNFGILFILFYLFLYFTTIILVFYLFLCIMYLQCIFTSKKFHQSTLPSSCTFQFQFRS